MFIVPDSIVFLKEETLAKSNKKKSKQTRTSQKSQNEKQEKTPKEMPDDHNEKPFYNFAWYKLPLLISGAVTLLCLILLFLTTGSS